MRAGAPLPGIRTTAGLATGFLESVDRWGDRRALVVDGIGLSYAELGQRAAAIAHAISQRGDGTRLTAILAQRSVPAYAGILGALLAGTGYVPLNPKFPVARLRAMLDASGSTSLVVGMEAIHLLPELIANETRPLLVVLPDAPRKALEEAFPRHRFVGPDGLTGHPDSPPVPRVADHDTAYLLFTSGTTGAPKGVAVTHGNVGAYLRYTADRYGVVPEDRFSQMFDLTFDLSVHDMFLCWERGACLYSVPERALVAPARFLREHELTMWFSVPSVVALMSRLRLLSPGAFPTLRWSLFCGEPLPVIAAEAWQSAAPESTVENLYGPTEATIAITHHRWDPDSSPERCVNGLVPIGRPFDEHACGPFSEDGQPVRPGAAGELWLRGPQVTPGYWRDAERTRRQFVIARDGSGPWYRTGDLVREDDAGNLAYLGRLDQQVKVRGYRVELQEVEAALRDIACGAQVAAVAWPVRDGSADGIVAFIAGGDSHDPVHVIDTCRRMLPEYMVPRTVRLLAEMPLNQNGKIDRNALTGLLEGGD